MFDIVVTGVGGFIGRHVAQKLVELGHKVVGVDDFSSGTRDSLEFLESLICIDLSDAHALDALPGSCDYIFHLAGQSSGEISFDDPIEDLKKNTLSTLNLIKYGVAATAQRIVYASSMSVYGAVEDHAVIEDEDCEPLSCYGAGKLCAEHYLRIYQDQLPFTIFRMFNVYGPGQDLSNLRQGMVSIYVAQALFNDIILVKGSSERFRDFIFIDDVVDVWCSTLYNQASKNRVYNLGTGARVTVKALLDQISEILPGRDVVFEGNTPGDQLGIFPDVTRLKHDFEIKEFVNLKSGLRKFCEWASSQGQKSVIK